jgi:uncharacterized hydrophobic protein (TIGR00271 family)
MHADAKADIDFYVLMVLAASIALFGLLQNSAAVIIGAMLVAPLMSPILAMAYSVVRGQAKMLRQATESAVNGIILAITVAALLSLLLVALGIPIPSTNEILARTQPNFLDLLVALASGAAAAYAISRSEVSAALPGVAIAAALVPPLAVVGYGLGTAQFDFAAGSLLLFLTNLAAIILAAATVFLLLGFRPPARDDRDEQARFSLKMAIVAMVLIAIPLFATTHASANQAARDQTVSLILENNWPPRQDEPVILSARTINVKATNYDDASAAHLLTNTPTPTDTATPESAPATKLPPANTPRPIATNLPQPTNTMQPVTSITSLPVITATLTQGISQTPEFSLTETAPPKPVETDQPVETPTITSPPTLTADP